MSRRPVVLIIRDGWGSNHNPDHDSFDAIKIAPTPVADALTDGWPRTELNACGLEVGLPAGIMGNSEVGHQNIGAGRIVDQELVRIDKGFATGALKDNDTLKTAFERVRAGGKLHLFGLISDAGVHAMLEHLYGLLDLCAEADVREVYVHAFTDGRDTAPTSGLGFVAAAEKKMASAGVGKIASVTGRFWSMDRDLRWERVQKAYDCLTGRAVERTAKSATEAVQFYYDNPLDASRKGDEFVVPTAVVGDDGEPIATVQDGDTVLFFNYRGDRPRELTRAFTEEGFDGFDRGDKLDLYFSTMTEYQKGLCPNVVFRKPPQMKHILGSFVADLGIPQFRCAETEKFPHVTFFFNDYQEEPFDLEDRELIQSPKEVSTYDQKPEMAAYGIKAATLAAIMSGKYGLIVVNFANADMVGHTGSLDAAVEACAVVDSCVGELLEAIDLMKGRALITADHGNSDQMKQVDGSAHTAHTLNPVEMVVYGDGCAALKLMKGDCLGDIAPTLLRLMKLPQPVAMTGECLIED